MTLLEPLREQTSLMHGWLPSSLQVLGAVTLVAGIGLRARRWLLVWLSIGMCFGAVAAGGVYWLIKSQGWAAGSPAPLGVWLWVGASGLALVTLAAGWRGTRWTRRSAAIMAVPLSLLCIAVSVNSWVGYFPTVQVAWNQVSGGPLPDQMDSKTVTALQDKGQIPAKGAVVAVYIGNAASKFTHRGEFVYLPPAWFSSNPAPRLPTVMMIGAEFSTPADWLRAGQAVKTMDDFAAAHGGYAPVLVFVDSAGAVNVDTECVNGPHGDVTDHFTKDVMPYLVSNFGVSPDRAHWGVAGWSMGGTCAVNLAVMHPEKFSAFVDIVGDIGPNSGNKAETINRLFGGDAAAWAAFDPMTVMTRHGQYHDLSGWFHVNNDGSAHPSDQATAANSLCTAGREHGINCAVVTRPGKHDWPFAAGAFAESLPWLAGALNTPGTQRLPLPQSPEAPE